MYLSEYNNIFKQWLLQGAGHNDVELYNQYLERLKTFVSHELTNWHKSFCRADYPGYRRSSQLPKKHLHSKSSDKTPRNSKNGCLVNYNPTSDQRIQSLAQSGDQELKSPVKASPVTIDHSLRRSRNLDGKRFSPSGSGDRQQRSGASGSADCFRSHDMSEKLL